MNYNYNNNINFDAANKVATQVLKSFFNPLMGGFTFGGQGNGAPALISTPVFLVNQGNKQVTVQLSYYLASSRPGVARPFSNDTLKSLTNALSQVYSSVTGQTVSVQLELVRQHQPYMDASILAQYLAINLSKHGFNRMTNLLLNAVPYLNPVPSGPYTFSLSYITGVKVQLSGLLTSQRNRSRKTVYTASVGTFHNNNMISNASAEGTSNKELTIDYGAYTSKSGLGAFTVKVWIASTSPQAPSKMG